MTGSAMIPMQQPSAGVAVHEGETASSAVSARAKASIEAAYVVALRNPRNDEQVRVKIVEACKRPRFAALARYAKPVAGQKIIGPSIRFVEEALRHFGNVLPEAVAVYDDADKRILKVSVTDLEANIGFSQDVVVEKTVERTTVKPGQRVLSVRENSNGAKTYLVAATEDDFLNKQNAAVSKVLRNLGLRILPSDIVEEAMEQVQDTLKSETAADPRAALKRVSDAFYSLGIDPVNLEEYLGHSIAICTPAEIDHLRIVFASLKDGEITWAQLMENRRAESGGTPGAASPPVATSKSKTNGVAGLKAKLGVDAPQREQSDRGGEHNNRAPADPAPIPRDISLLMERENIGARLSDEEAETLRQWQIDHPVPESKAD